MNGRPLIDAHTHVGADLHFYLLGHYPYAQDWPALVRAGDAEGIDSFVVFPMPGNLYLFGKLAVGEKPVPYAFENRRLMVEINGCFPEHAPRAIPFWMIDSSREQKSQIAELRRLREEFSCAGLKLQATMLKSFVGDLLREGGVFLDLAEEWDVPFLIHSSIDPADIWSPMQKILDVVASRPKVRFNVAHSCRFDREALDRLAALDNAWFDCSAHRIHCRLALLDHAAVASAERRFPSDYQDPTAVLAALHQAYPGKLLWGSDAPFDSYIDQEIQLLSSYREEAATLKSLPSPVVETIAWANTIRYLGRQP